MSEISSKNQFSQAAPKYLWFARLSPQEPWKFGNISSDFIEILLDAAEAGLWTSALRDGSVEVALFTFTPPAQMSWSFQELPAGWRCLSLPEPE